MFEHLVFFNLRPKTSLGSQWRDAIEAVFIRKRNVKRKERYLWEEKSRKSPSKRPFPLHLPDKSAKRVQDEGPDSNSVKTDGAERRERERGAREVQAIRHRYYLKGLPRGAGAQYKSTRLSA